jgi:hypothetical protein
LSGYDALPLLPNVVVPDRASPLVVDSITPTQVTIRNPTATAQATRFFVWYQFTDPGSLWQGLTGVAGVSGIVNPLDFGAKFDGVTDDTVAIQAAINAAIDPITGAGMMIQFPAGRAVITATLIVRGVAGLNIVGVSKDATDLRWAGPAGIPMWLYDVSSGCRLALMTMTVDGAALLETFVEMGETGAVAGTSSGNGIELVDMLAGGRAAHGVHYRLYNVALDQKNDLHWMREVKIQRYTDRGVIIEGYNAKKLYFENLKVQGRRAGQIGLDTASIAGRGGSFSWYGGECQENVQWDFQFGTPNDPIVISGVYSQTSTRWFTVINDQGSPQPTEPWPVIFDGHRWATANTNLPADGEIVQIYHPGPVAIRGSKVGANAAFGTLRMRYEPRRIAGYATGDLDVTGIIADGEVVILGTETYTWRAALAAGGLPFEVLIAGSVALSLVNLEAAINLEEGGEGIDYGIGTTINVDAEANRIDADTLRATAKLPGIAGNNIASTTTMINGVWTGAFLSGGAAAAFENVRGGFMFEHSLLCSAGADDDVFPASPPDSLDGSLHLTNTGDIRAMIRGQGEPYEADWFMAQVDQDWIDRGMPVPRVWQLANTSTGQGAGLVLDQQRRYRTLDLHPYQMALAQYQQAIAPWTGTSITSTGAQGQMMSLDDTDNLIDTINVPVAMGGYFKLTTPGVVGHFLVVGGGLVGAGGGPLVRQLNTGRLQIAADGALTNGLIDHSDGNEHPVICIVDPGDAAYGFPARLLVVTDLEIITAAFPATLQSIEGKGIGSKAAAQDTWVGSWRKFFVWIGADVRRIKATGTPGAWQRDDIIALLRAG